MNEIVLAVVLGVALLACATGGSESEAPPEPTSYQGALRVAPSPAVFEDTPAGCTASVVLELESSRDAGDLVVTGASLPGSDFLLEGDLPISLPPGRRAALDLHFVPDAPGDRSGAVGFTTDEGDRFAQQLPVEARALPAPPDPATEAPIGAVDLVLVLDVSTSVRTTRALRAALEELFLLVQTRALDVRLGLTTFVNDVLVHREGAFLDRAAFLAELDSQLGSEAFAPDPEQPRQLLNFEAAENTLGALHRSATEFPLRPGARHVLLLVTDDTFLEPPAVFSDGTPAAVSYAEVASTLAERDVELFSLHAAARGRGLSSALRGEPSLVSATGGRWFELSRAVEGSRPLSTLLAGILAGSPCAVPEGAESWSEDRG